MLLVGNVTSSSSFSWKNPKSRSSVPKVDEFGFEHKTTKGNYILSVFKEDELLFFSYSSLTEAIFFLKASIIFFF